MQAVSVLLLAVAALFVVAVAAPLVARRALAGLAIYGACAVLCAVSLVVAAWSVGSGMVSSLFLPVGLPGAGAHFRIDALSAFFLIVVNLGGVFASLYGIGYGRHEEAPQRVLPFFPVFIAGMNLVLVADDAFAFLVAWEFMSLTSWAMVLAHHRDRANTRAAGVYLVMASFGTMALLVAFALLAGAGDNFSFDALRAAGHTPAVAMLVLGAMILGAGSKAGLVPLHVWLPLAHPAAPSHVSALMSGVMTKVAVYGFVRVVFDLLGEPAWWSGMLLMFLGGATALIGILHALMESDLKRMLAYSTIENIGVIFAGLGLALAFRASDLDAAAALALTAALLHVFNHSLFKSLLFFGAGAVLTATGERDMGRLGGLIHKMPATSLFFLAGCVAISALPPFNGFVSEWLTFQAILQSPQLPGWDARIMAPALGGVLALAAALAAACFVRAFGIAFLGRARSDAASHAGEVDRLSLGVMGALAVLCLLAGILPGFVIDAIAPVTAMLSESRLPPQSSVPWLSIIPVAEGYSSYNGLLVLMFILVSAAATAFVVHRIGARGVRRAPAWDCGFPLNDPATQYGPESFAQPLRRVFGGFTFAARERVTMPPPGDPAPARFEAERRDRSWDLIYTPIGRMVERAGEYVNRFQFLTIRAYLSMVFFVLVALLAVLALWT